MKNIAATVTLSLFALAGTAVAQSPASGTTATVEKKGDEKPPLGGLSFDFYFGDSSNLNNIGHKYQNDMFFYFLPSWSIGERFLPNTRFKNMYLSSRFSVTRELAGIDEGSFTGNIAAGPQGTCSNITPTTNGGLVPPGQVGNCNPAQGERRTDYSDIWLDFGIPKIYTIPKVGININPSFRVVLPASQQSRFQSLVMTLRPGFSLSRSFWNSHITLSYGLAFAKNFHQRTSTEYTLAGGQAQAQGGNPYDGVNGSGLSNFFVDPSRQATEGGLNVSHSLINLISLRGTWLNDKVYASLLYILSSGWTYSPSGGCIMNVPGVGPTDVCANGAAVAGNSNSEIRAGRHDSQVFWASVGYHPLDWLGIDLSLITASPLTYANTSPRQPFISTNYDALTTINLGASVTIDKLAYAIKNRVKRGN